MQTSRTLLQLASKLAKQSTESIPAPYIYEPASKAPSPYSSIIIATGVGIAMAGSYKVRRGTDGYQDKDIVLPETAALLHEPRSAPDGSPPIVSCRPATQRVAYRGASLVYILGRLAAAKRSLCLHTHTHTRVQKQHPGLLPALAPKPQHAASAATRLQRKQLVSTRQPRALGYHLARHARLPVGSTNRLHAWPWNTSSRLGLRADVVLELEEGSEPVLL